jgi:hypothetical protein
VVPYTARIDDEATGTTQQDTGLFRYAVEFTAMGITNFVAFFSALEGPPTEVSLDITPGKTPNCVNPNKAGVLTVALLGSQSFNVSEVNVGTVRIDDDEDPSSNGVAASKNSVSDVNKDGIPDLVAQFTVSLLKDAGLLTHGAELNVTATMTDSTTIIGTDLIFLAGQSPCR